MKQFISFVIKEAKHILRDKRTMLILFGMPVVMMLLFGFAITNDVRNVRTVVVTSQMDHLTRTAVERLAASEYFTIVKTVPTPKDAEWMIRSQKADLAIVFAQDFASKKSGAQFIVDGSDPNMAQQWTTYAQQVVANPNVSLISQKLLYNPRMKSAYNFVPAIMGMLLLLILCDDDLCIDCSRKRTWYDGGVARVANQAADDYRGEGSALSVVGTGDSSGHPADVGYGARCAAARWPWMDTRRFAHLYPVGSLARSAYLEYRAYAVCGPARISDGIVVAYCDALGYAVSCGVNANYPAMDIGYHSTTLLYSGHAQADDYGCGNPRSMARGCHPYWYDIPATRCLT